MIFTEVKKMALQNAAWSDYKCHFTVEFIVCDVPN